METAVGNLRHGKWEPIHHLAPAGSLDAVAAPSGTVPLPKSGA
jgi:hypothetical protein